MPQALRDVFFDNFQEAGGPEGFVEAGSFSMESDPEVVYKAEVGVDLDLWDVFVGDDHRRPRQSWNPEHRGLSKLYKVSEVRMVWGWIGPTLRIPSSRKLPH